MILEEQYAPFVTQRLKKAMMSFLKMATKCVVSVQKKITTFATVEIINESNILNATIAHNDKNI